MSDEQILEYVTQEREKGTPQSRIVTHLMQQGVTAKQIRKLRQKYGNMNSNSSSERSIGSYESKDRMRVNNSVYRLQNGKELKRKSELDYEEYAEQEEQARQYSQGRIGGYNDRNTYDENDPDYLDI